MGFYSIYKIIKDMIKTLFGKTFLKIVIIGLIIIIGYTILSHNGVFAATNVVIEDIFTDEDIERARTIVGESIWNNENYDILFVYDGWAWRNGSSQYNNNVPDIKYGKTIVYYDTTNITSTKFKLLSQTNTTNYGFSWLDGVLQLWNEDISSVSFSKTYNNIYLGNSGFSSNVTNTGLEFDSNKPNTNIAYFKPIRLSYDIYDASGNLIVRNNKPVSPYFVTTNQELETFDFDYFQINGGTAPYYTEIASGVGGNPTFYLTYNYKGVNTNIDVTDYVSVNETDNTWAINIPYTKLVENVIVRNGESFSYSFTYNPFYR